MKKLILPIIGLTSLLLFNCSSDDSINDPNSGDDDVIEVPIGSDETPKDPTEIPTNPIEETPINLAILEDGISISNATIETGTITPTGTIAFEIEETEQSGFLDTGFSINLKVPTNYAGSFVQLLDESGNPSDEYFNVSTDFPSFNNLNEKSPKNILSGRAHKTISNDEPTNEVSIDVKFDNTIPAGRFCYWICPYDADGNISEPVEICVEVEAWGGNSALVGSWIYNRVESVENGVREVIRLGDKDCFTSSTFCDGEQLEVEQCDAITSLVLIIKENGEQQIINNGTFDRVDFDENTNCSKLTEVIEETTSTGNWAYNEEEKKLTLVNFEFSGTENGEPISDEFEIADNEGIGFDVKVILVTSNELVIEASDTYTDSSGVTIEEIDTIYLTK